MSILNLGSVHLDWEAASYDPWATARRARTDPSHFPDVVRPGYRVVITPFWSRWYVGLGAIFVASAGLVLGACALLNHLHG